MCAEPIKILFQDVDGCLNPADGEDLSAEPGGALSGPQLEMLAAINAAIEASPLEHWVINTGRYWPIFQSIAAQLPTPKLRYFLFEHACVLYDRELDANLDLHAIARSCQLPELAARYANLGAMQRLLQWYDAAGQAQLEAIYHSPLARLDKVANLSFELPPASDGDQVLAAVEALIRQHCAPADCAQLEFCRSDRFIDILPGIHKLDGIELVCAYLNTPSAQALAMGDYLNDLAIFESFPRVLCPANAHPRILELTRQKGAGGQVSPHSYGAALLDFLQ